MTIEPHDLEEFSGDHPELTAMIAEESVAGERFGRAKNAARIVGQSLLGQGTAQAINLLATLFLVHRLSIEAYAQFGLALGFQTVFSVLMDLGFASTIVPLVADRRDDKALVGRYVRSANHLRNRLFVFLVPIAAISFLAIMHKHHWGVRVQLLLLGSVLISLYSGGTMAYFSAPLFIFRQLKDYYLPQVIFGAVRLGAYFALAFTGGLNAWTAAGFSALYLTGTSRYVRRKSQRYIEWPKEDSPATDKEMLKYILPASPAIIFSAFQVQISLFLVSIFGGTLYIAEVAALSRIGQLFVVFLTLCGVVVEPYMARLSREKLLRNYLAFVAMAILACVPLVFVAFRWPGAYLLLIGAKYSGVRDLMGLYVMAMSINFVFGVIWIMNRSRKWVFWSGSILEVVLLVGMQVGFLALIGVRNTKQAVYFSFVASFCYAVAHGYVAIYGFLKGPRVTPGDSDAATGADAVLASAT